MKSKTKYDYYNNKLWDEHWYENDYISTHDDMRDRIIQAMSDLDKKKCEPDKPDKPTRKTMGPSSTVSSTLAEMINDLE